MDEDFERNNPPYKVLYLHKVSCPREVFEESKQLFMDAYEAGYKKDVFGFWNWGDQVFIPEKDLSKLNILSVQEKDVGDLIEGGQRRYRQWGWTKK